MNFSASASCSSIRKTIFRAKKDKNFSVVSNTYLDDRRLSLKAKGLLTCLLSKPDNWKIYVSYLQKQSPDGRDSIYSGLRELERFGYIKKNMVRDEKGIIRGAGYIVIENPDSPEAPQEPESQPENPHPGFQDTGNPKLLNTDSEPILKKRTTDDKAPASVVVVSSEPGKKLRKKPDTVLQAGSKAGKAAVPEEIPGHLRETSEPFLQAYPEPESSPEPEDELASVLEKIPEEYRKKLTPLIRAKLKAGKPPEVIVANALYSIAHKPQKLQAYTGCAIDKDYAGSSGWVPEDVQQEAQAALRAQQKKLRKEAEEEAIRQQNVEKENALREKARERFRQMSAEEQQNLRNAFLKQAHPFTVKRFLRLPFANICNNIPFLDFIAMAHACVSP